MHPAADPPPGTRLALVIATGTYADGRLRRLRAPAQDAADLAQILARPDIGGFTVSTVIDQPAQQIRLAVEDFLANRGTGDLLLVYLSCHGLLDARRRLYFAATDTRKDRLGATGVESAWVLDQLEHCRARRQVLILDSCFSGAFAHGAKGEADLGLRDRFGGQGRGRVVLTASAATEYSFEGEPTDAATSAGSVFTAALVHGLRTGAADTDHDGYISVDDAYAYVFDQVQAAGAAQTPQRWLYGTEGSILLARSPAGPIITPTPLPESLRVGLDSPHPSIRLGAVSELGEWLTGGDSSRAATARRHLHEVAATDIPRVARAARTLLDTGTTAEPSAAAIRDSAAPAPAAAYGMPGQRTHVPPPGTGPGRQALPPLRAAGTAKPPTSARAVRARQSRGRPWRWPASLIAAIALAAALAIALPILFTTGTPLSDGHRPVARASGSAATTPGKSSRTSEPTASSTILPSSTGPQQANIPNVIGDMVAQATRVLQAAGFKVEVNTYGQFDKVFDYSPTGQAPRGSTVIIDVGF